MKRIVESSDAEGLEGLLGKQVLLMCASYFYTGELVGVNENHVVLRSASIVYETGDWKDDTWKDAQSLPFLETHVMVSHIESYGGMPC